MATILIEGPTPDIEQFRTELIDAFAAGDVLIGNLRERQVDILDDGEFGASPVMDFVIEVAAGATVSAITVATQIVYGKVKNWRRLRVKSDALRDRPELTK